MAAKKLHPGFVFCLAMAARVCVFELCGVLSDSTADYSDPEKLNFPCHILNSLRVPCPARLKEHYVILCMYPLRKVYDSGR